MKNRNLTLFVAIILFLVSNTIYAQFDLLGEPINGQDATSLFGYSTDLDDAGITLAVGASFQTVDGLGESGYAQVFEWIDEGWVQKGQTIFGEVSQEYCGHKVSLNADGTILAVSSPGGSPVDDLPRVRVYSFDGSLWMPLGPVIYGESGSGFGLNMAMNDQGNIISIASPNYDYVTSQVGIVSTYVLHEGNWLFRGGAKVGDQFNDFLGRGLALSGDGNTLAIGQSKSLTSPDADGQVDIYRYNGIHYLPIGNAFYGDANSLKFGTNLVLTEDGNTVAISDNMNSEGGLYAGKVWIFSFDDTENWTPKGAPIIGDYKQYLGVTLDLDKNGERLLAASPVPYDFMGEALVFDYSDTGVWTQVEEAILGQNSNDQFGWSASLSRNGKRLSVGAINAFNPSDVNTGELRVYGLPTLLSVSEVAALDTVLYPIPTNSILQIYGNLNLTQSTYNIVNVAGQLMLFGDRIPQSGIDVSELNTGVYFIKIQSEDWLQTLRFIKN